jgi:tetratricopeptide (TPR) repeat protein
MPSTVNGIGTHYYGKKNLQTRPGVCEFCRRDSVLSSYDTMLWFVVVFIPVIPLGRKRILDYCAHCTRHRVLSLKKWEDIKQKNLTEVMDGMKAAPNDPKAAIKVHSSLVAFGQHGEAEKVAAMMKERFSNDAGTLAYLGSTMEYLGKDAQAVPYYQRALELNPELPEAKIAVGLDLVGKGRLEEARALLKFLEAPGMNQAPGALYALANGYQRAGKHKEALELYQLLIERFPKIAQDKGFRKAVKQSELAAGGGALKLPAREVNWKPMAIVGGAAVVAVVIALGSNYYISQHRTVYVVSDLPKSVTVDIGREHLVLAKRGISSVTIAEGRHEAVFAGAKQAKVNFEIKSGFWKRWFDKPVYILNADGSALLIQESTTYSAKTSSASSGGGYTFYFGETFIVMAEVDYPFQPFPDSITLDSHASAVSKSRVDMFEQPAQTAFLALVMKSRLGDALRLAEWYLPSHPAESDFLSYYVFFAQQNQQEDRARKFLAEGAKRRPIEITWHRAYQETRAQGTNGPALVAEYDALLKAEPDNPDLMYLRGRLSSRQHEAMPLYEKALAKDPTNAFAHYALGQNQLAGEAWPDALTHLTEASRLRPSNQQFLEGFIAAQIALRKFPELEANLAKILAAKPLDIGMTENLGIVYVLQNKTTEVTRLLNGYRQALQRDREADVEETMEPLQEGLLYAQGNFEQLEKIASAKRAGQAVPGRFYALIELGKFKEAAAMVDKVTGGAREPFDILALSIACKQAGDNAESDRLRAQAVERLSKNRFEYVATAEVLKSSQPTPLADVMDLSLTPGQKAVVLTVQGQRFAEGRSEIFTAARRLNFMPQFPYHLVNRVTERGPAQ